jgi:hypothetical protein
MSKLIFSIALVFCFQSIIAQPSQNVRGKVVDAETNYPLVGVKIEIFTQDSLENSNRRSQFR